jgi:hypothetical protein
MSFIIYQLKGSNIIETFEFSDLQFLHINAIPHETFVTMMHYTCTDNSEESNFLFYPWMKINEENSNTLCSQTSFLGVTL